MKKEMSACLEKRITEPSSSSLEVETTKKYSRKSVKNKELNESIKIKIEDENQNKRITRSRTAQK
jgi:hypothetical protein